MLPPRWPFFARGAVVLGVAAFLAIALATPTPAHPQPGPADPDAAGDADDFPVLVFVDYEAEELIAGARDQLKRNQAATAIQLLTRILERETPMLGPAHATPLVRSAPGVFRDARTVVTEILRQLPAEAITDYRLKYDGVARREFDLARAASDPVALSAMVNRFPLATCRKDALDALAHMAFDHAQFALAASAFGDSCREFPAEDSAARAAALARWCLAAHLAGQADVVRDLRAELARDFPDEIVAIGEDEFTGATFAPARLPIAGLIASGDAWARVPGVGLLQPVTSEDRPGDFDGALPANFGAPLWATDTPMPDVSAEREPNQRAPLAGNLLRTPTAIAAGDRLIFAESDAIRVFNAVTGKLLWTRPRTLALNHDQLAELNLFGVVGQQQPGVGVIDGLFDAAPTEGFETVATTPGRVFALCRLDVWRSGTQWNQAVQSRGPLAVLAAFDADTGRILWVRGDFSVPGVELPAGDRFEVLRGPVPIAGRLLVPLRADTGLFLACIEPRDGTPRWLTYLHADPLADAMKNARDQARPRIRERVMAPIVAGELALVVSNFGTVTAVDAHTGMLRWVAEFSPDFADARRFASLDHPHVAPWLATPAVVAGHLIGAPRPANCPATVEGFIIDIASGITRAKIPGIGEWLGVADPGLGDGPRILTVDGNPDNGTVRLRAHDLRGQQSWAVRVPDSTGMGAIVNARTILWPCAKRLRAFDLASGEFTIAPRIQPTHTLGDLWLVGGLLVSRHAEQTQVFLDPVRAAPKIAAAIAAHPDWPDGYLRRAQLALLDGDRAAAANDVREAARKADSAAMRAVVLKAWLDVVDARVGAGESLAESEFAEIREFAARTAGPLEGAKIGVRLALMAGQPDAAAETFIAQLIATAADSVGIAGENRRVNAARDLAAEWPGWRALGGAAFVRAVENALAKTCETLAATDGSGAARAHLLAVASAVPNAAAVRATVAETVAEAGNWPLAAHLALENLATDAGIEAAVIARSAAVLFAAANALKLAELEARAVAAMAAVPPAIEVPAGDGQSITAANWLLARAEIFARWQISEPPAVADLTPFAVRPAFANGLAVGVRGPMPAGVREMVVDPNSRTLAVAMGASVRTIALRPRGENRAEAEFPRRPAAWFVSETVVVLATDDDLCAVDIAARAVKWARPWSDAPADSGLPAARAARDGVGPDSAVVVGNTVIFADRERSPNAPARRQPLILHAFDAVTGEEKWRQSADDSRRTFAVPRLLPHGSRIVRVDESNRTLGLLSPLAGGFSCELVLRDGVDGARLASDGALIVRLRPAEVRGQPAIRMAAYDLPVPGTSEPPRVRWVVDTAEIAAWMPAGPVVVAEEGEFIRARRIADGAILAEVSGSGLLAARAVDGRVWIAHRAGDSARVVAVDVASGEQSAAVRIEPKSPAFAYPPAAVELVPALGPRRAPRLLVATMRGQVQANGLLIRRTRITLEIAVVTADESPRLTGRSALLDTQAPATTGLYAPRIGLDRAGDAFRVSPDGLPLIARFSLQRE